MTPSLVTSPDRKCMSVVVREEESGRIWLLTKGAESSVLRRCRVDAPDERSLHDTTLSHINHYAMVREREIERDHTYTKNTLMIRTKLYKKYK